MSISIRVLRARRRDSKTYAANRRQFAKWQNSSPCLSVFARTITYRGATHVEKGVDVALAIDLVRCALFDDACDIAILFSSDTDLLPALELISTRKGPTLPLKSRHGAVRGNHPPLDIPHARLRQHRLEHKIYRRVEDRTDYNLGHQTRR